MREKRYCVFDCETATLPYAEKFNSSPEQKKRVAIARPLIYDMGWAIVNRKGEILDKKQFLIAETFSVPQIFNTAYYREKRPMYLEMLKKKEISVLPWEDAINIFLEDIANIDSVGAFNSMFDFKKAIPFTELYINKLYSPDYDSWYTIQKSLCDKIATQPYKKTEENEFESNVFRFRDKEYPLFDLWGLATKYLLDNQRYKKNCLENDMISESGLFFKTSAESTYRYLKQMFDFNESHTALDDAIIESFILSRIARKHAIDPGIISFPFRILGETPDFIQEGKKIKEDAAIATCEKIREHFKKKVDESAEKINDNYIRTLKRKLNGLEMYLGLEQTEL